jgi:hypothetical protein
LMSELGERVAGVSFCPFFSKIMNSEKNVTH